MAFANITFNKLVKKYNGWTEKGIARFPSPYLKEEFLKEMRAYKESKTKPASKIA